MNEVVLQFEAGDPSKPIVTCRRTGRSIEIAVELINATRMPAGYTCATDVTGREHLVVVVKATFRLPAFSEPVVLHDDQVPLVLSDSFTGAPGLTAIIHESDYALRKSACDVLLVGSEYAPGGRRVPLVTVGMRVGTVAKAFQVTGNRWWSATPASVRPTSPEPFVTQSISYDVAFGGVDDSDPDAIAAFDRNPAGRGFGKRAHAAWLDGRPLPNTEETGRPVEFPDGNYRPVAFGSIGRSWQPRRGFAGTYDEQWLDEVFPCLPADFDERYFQAAPDDQQMAIPSGPVEVALSNLTPDGQRRFALPVFKAPIHVFPRNGPREEHFARVDTIVFEPDAERFTVTFRVCRPLRRDVFDIGLVVGGGGREWWLAQSREEGADATAGEHQVEGSGE